MRKKKNNILLMTIASLVLCCGLAFGQQTQTCSMSTGSSGQALNCVNSLQGAGSLTVTYAFSGSPATASIVLYGFSGGAPTGLYTYSSTATITHTVTLGAKYDYFQVVPTWTGGVNVSLSAGLTISGAGPPPVIPTVTANAIRTVTTAPAGCTYSTTANPVVSYNGTIYSCGSDNLYHAPVGGVTGATLLGTTNQITVTGVGSCASTTVFNCQASLSSTLILPGTLTFGPGASHVPTGASLDSTGGPITATSAFAELNANDYAGANIGAQVNAAIAACPSSQRCQVIIPAGSYSYSTTITIPTLVDVSCAAGGQATLLTYTGTTTGILISGAGSRFHDCAQAVGNTTTYGINLTGNQAQLYDITQSGGGTGTTLIGVHNQGSIISNWYVNGTAGTMLECDNAIDAQISHARTYGTTNNKTSRTLVVDSGCNGLIINDWTGGYSGLHGLVVQNTLTGGDPTWLFANGFISDVSTGGDGWLFDSTLGYSTALGMVFENSWAAGAGIADNSVNPVTPNANGIHISGGKGITIIGSRIRTNAAHGILIDSTNVGDIQIEDNQIVSNNQNNNINLTLSAAGNASAGATQYTGTTPICAANACVGLYFNVSGFSTSANNVGNLACTASDATHITLANASGAAETHAGLATFVASGVAVTNYASGGTGAGGLLIAGNSIGNLWGDSNAEQSYGIDIYTAAVTNEIISNNNLASNASGTMIDNTPLGSYVHSGNVGVTDVLNPTINGLPLGVGGGFNSSNVAIGSSALASNSSGYQNVAVGVNAGVTATGANANTTGFLNTWVGTNAGASVATQLTNSFAFGQGAQNSVSNQGVMGNQYVTDIYFGGTQGASNVHAANLTRSFGATFDGGGSALAAATSYVVVPYACTIKAWNILVDTGTATFTTWRVATGTALPTVSNTLSTAGVAISSNTALHSTNVSDFAVPSTSAAQAIAKDDIIGIHIVPASSATWAQFTIECQP